MKVRLKLNPGQPGTRPHQAGGRWSKSRRLWKLPRKTVAQLGLEERIVAGMDGEAARAARVVGST